MKAKTVRALFEALGSKEHPFKIGFGLVDDMGQHFRFWNNVSPTAAHTPTVELHFEAKTSNHALGGAVVLFGSPLDVVGPSKSAAPIAAYQDLGRPDASPTSSGIDGDAQCRDAGRGGGESGATPSGESFPKPSSRAPWIVFALCSSAAATAWISFRRRGK